jgi:hypothetical protein
MANLMAIAIPPTPDPTIIACFLFAMFGVSKCVGNGIKLLDL